MANNFKQRFHKAYLKQMNQDCTESNIEEYSLDEGRLVLLNETPTYFIIKVLDDGQAGEFLNVVFKEDLRMETICL